MTAAEIEPQPSPRTPARPRIVIVGAGFAGAYAVQRIEQLFSPGEADITLIDRNNYLVFTPLLVEAGIGSLEPRHTVVSIRNFTKASDFVMGTVSDVDLENRRVTVQIPQLNHPRFYEYDHLVLCLGSVTMLPPVPGLREHGFQMKGLADAVALRDRAIQMLESASHCDDPELRRELLHFVVVGGSFTGIEVAGEFHAFMQRAARVYPRLDPSDIRMTLVEHGSRILRLLDDELAEYATQHLRGRGVDIRTGSTVNAMDERSATLADGERLATRTVIWCAGIAPNPLIAKIGLPLNERGYILCERDFRVKGMENVWAIGDGAVNPDENGIAYPPTAQHAVRMGRHLAENLRHALHNHPTEPFDFATQGELAPLGCRKAVARVFGFKLSGFAAWWLWRTVYLVKMPGFWRKVRIALDWTIDMFIGREYAQLGLHRKSTTGN